MLKNLVLFLATFLTALSAGLLFAYACSVNPGLNRLPDAAYLMAMQNINMVIQNPVFFVAFLGPVILLPWSAWGHRQLEKRRFRHLLFAAAVLYIIGVLGVTMFGNVPLNQALEVFDVRNASIEQIMQQRLDFEVPWNMWHLTRTVCALASLLCCLGALFTFLKNDD